MIEAALFTLTLAAALGCGLMAGFFFAFSAGVMRALARLAPAKGIAAMQAINVAVINPAFMMAFLGTAAACAALVVAALVSWDRPGSAYRLVGGLLYLVGALLVTFLFNVPRNDALAAVEAAGADGSKPWAGYL